jgi:hypothetical protein
MYATQWSRLDNAAKIFPPSTTKDDTKVFRFICELYEDIDAQVLQHALNLSLTQFPFYRFIIRRGFFWYYFERSDLEPVVCREYKPLCAPLYDVNRHNLLFEVTFYRKRINLEIYHALSDGVGALQFLRTIVCYYLLEKHRGELDGDIVLDGNEASDEQRSRDAFDTYYAKEKAPKGLKVPKFSKSYRIKSEFFPESRMGLIEGHISTSAIIQKAREYHATVSEFLTTQLICSIHECMNIRDEMHPISVTVPVDLRKYFPTTTARNFFSTINVAYVFSEHGKQFEDVLLSVQNSFKEQLSPEKISERLNQLSSFEHALPIKVVPLAVKAPVLRNVAWRAAQVDSAGLSNIGRITMPSALVPYIHLFDAVSRNVRPNICMCSFEDVFVISFSSSIVSSDIQRSFFRALQSLGLAVEIAATTADLGV